MTEDDLLPNISQLQKDSLVPGLDTTKIRIIPMKILPQKTLTKKMPT
jgi:hypothetical protein